VKTVPLVFRDRPRRAAECGPPYPAHRQRATFSVWPSYGCRARPRVRMNARRGRLRLVAMNLAAESYGARAFLAVHSTSAACQNRDKPWRRAVGARCAKHGPARWPAVSPCAPIKLEFVHSCGARRDRRLSSTRQIFQKMGAERVASEARAGRPPLPQFSWPRAAATRTYDCRKRNPAFFACAPSRSIRPTSTGSVGCAIAFHVPVGPPHRSVARTLSAPARCGRRDVLLTNNVSGLVPTDAKMRSAPKTIQRKGVLLNFENIPPRKNSECTDPAPAPRTPLVTAPRCVQANSAPPAAGCQPRTPRFLVIRREVRFQPAPSQSTPPSAPVMAAVDDVLASNEQVPPSRCPACSLSASSISPKIKCKI